MVVNEKIEAEDRAALEQARREVSLKVSREADHILICADGPFREPYDCTKWRQERRHGWPEDPPYRVIYELELQVPRSIDIKVGTIEGHLVITGVRGRVETHGVNGKVEIEGAAGTVQAGTVNGPVDVHFVENPKEDSTFSTINGEIDVFFQPSLSADLSFETMNSNVMTDFEYRFVTPVATRTESSEGGTIWRLEVDFPIRIGRSGPHHRFKNINGDITIHRND
jgi:hypothetical protein